MKLVNLEGLSVKEIDCKFFGKAGQVKAILQEGIAATAAESNGAINVYIDDNKKYRCEMYRFLRKVDSAIYTNFKDVYQWTKNALKDIE